jgi:hypothetical protein
MMNVYEKLVQARIMFQAGNPKMSGENKFAKYSYFELSDILPVINKLAKELGFVCAVSFSESDADLSFIDSEKPTERIIFTSPMAKADLKGCHDVQNLGAVETYIKRYLYQNCFEIVENDVLNGTHNEPVSVQTKPSPKIMDEIKTLIEAVDENNIPIYDEAWKAKYRALLKERGADYVLTELKKAVAK